MATFKDLPSYGDHMEIECFKECVEIEMFIPYDGTGYLATKDKMSNELAPMTVDGIDNAIKDFEWATHVMWFNR